MVREKPHSIGTGSGGLCRPDGELSLNSLLPHDQRGYSTETSITRVGWSLQPCRDCSAMRRTARVCWLSRTLTPTLTCPDCLSNPEPDLDPGPNPNPNPNLDSAPKTNPTPKICQAKPARRMKGEEMDEEEKRRLSLTKQPRASVTSNTFALHVAPVRTRSADVAAKRWCLC